MPNSHSLDLESSSPQYAYITDAGQSNMQGGTQKNMGSFLAFDGPWFERHQSGLLFFLNNPLTRRLTRRLLGINTFDCPESALINKIGPHCLVFGASERNGVVNFQTDFRTHPKFAKRLYYALRPLWWTIHIWDEFIADPWLPQLSFGFSTLVVYPDKNPESDTVDGSVFHASAAATWATLQGGAGTGSNDTNSNGTFFEIDSSSSSDRWDVIQRSIFLFDTSELPDDCTISSSTFSLWPTQLTDGLSITPNAAVYSSAPASNTALVAGDYDSLGSTEFSDVLSWGDLSTGSYNDWTLNASGIAAIDKAGITKFGLRNKNYDVDNSEPSWSSDTDSKAIGYFADQTGTSNDPKLTINYSTPATDASIFITNKWGPIVHN